MTLSVHMRDAKPRRTESGHLMKSYQCIRKGESFLGNTTLLVFLATASALSAIPRTEVSANVVLWDTGSPLTGVTNGDDRSRWKRVPTDLFTLEADPPKAASDPGYYGRDYSFKGDAVVENRRVTAVFKSSTGRVMIYSKQDGGSPIGTPLDPILGKKVAEFTPLQGKTQPTSITRVEVLRNAGDDVVLEVSFSAKNSTDISAVFAFGKSEIVEINPGKEMKGVSLFSPIEYGVLPSFIGDDLIFNPEEYTSVKTLSVPAENLFIGMLKGEENLLVMTWPKGKQQMSLKLSSDLQGTRQIESIDFDNDGQSFYLAALGAPGIWHREKLHPSYLEKDVAIKWKKPFSAKWKTQLDEAGVKAAFAFREAKSQVWRGVPGSYSYPVWFSGNNAFFHLSKKVPPKGECLIYFVEGSDTPVSVSTPVDIMKETLGRQMAGTILDVAGRKLRTHHRRGGEGVHRACTCGYTEAIQAVFETGEEISKKDYIQGALDDMIYFVRQHVERIEEYRRFADDTIKLLRAQGLSSPELKPFLEGLEQIAQQIPQEYDVQKENMKSLPYADELARQTAALASKKDPNNLKAYMDLLKAWRAMGGSQDYVLAQCHTITRKLFQEAGYGCVHQPKAVEFAQEIRKRCRQSLRNADGYEIWPEY